jgi:hypothetical protein
VVVQETTDFDTAHEVLEKLEKAALLKSYAVD